MRFDFFVQCVYNLYILLANPIHIHFFIYFENQSL